MSRRSTNVAHAAFVAGRVTYEEYADHLLGSLDIGKRQIFNIQSKDTPVPWGTYAPLYEGRAAQVQIDKLLGLW